MKIKYEKFKLKYPEVRNCGIYDPFTNSRFHRYLLDNGSL